MCGAFAAQRAARGQELHHAVNAEEKERGPRTIQFSQILQRGHQVRQALERIVLQDKRLQSHHVPQTSW
jgi:hypothetical protein